jgi:hypothetical protein
MQNAHPIWRQMNNLRTSTDTTTRVVALSPRHVALYHLKRFAKVSVVAATAIIALLYAAMLIVGVPTINL